MRMILRTSWLIVLLCVFSCNAKKSLAKAGDCDTIGTVEDMTGLDGCNLMIVLENGTKLQPVRVVPDFELKAGTKVSFSYRPLPDMMSTCMAGTIVEITCIKEKIN